MILLQIVVPAVLVFIVFIVGHLFVSSDGSGLYVTEINFDPETVLEEPEEVNPIDIDPETGLILPDKYNYLKIENVFSGQLVDVDALFSIEVALLTKQPSVSSDLFIAALFEIENEVVAAITPSILDLHKSDLITVEGRQMLSERIREAVNRWLENEKDMRPAITEVFIINLNIV